MQPVFWAGRYGLQPVATHLIQRSADMANLCLDHKNDRFAADANMWTEKDDEIREACDAGAQMRFHPVRPDLAQSQAIGPCYIQALYDICNMKPGIPD